MPSSRLIAQPIEALETRLLFTVPAGFTETTVVANLPYVAAMTVAPDGRVFIAEQKTGKIRVVKNGQMLATPFATLPVRAALETGLLGVTVDPNFASNGYVYAYWTKATPDVHNVVTRFTASGDVAGGSGTEIISLPGPAQIHQGGMIGFGPDGKLYVPVGDHGRPTTAQSMTSPYGKVLRFNRDGTIPTDNPFYNQNAGINRAIWASGLRNPFQFDFQPGTGRMYINDVGSNTWEEINQGVKGANYGWPGIEGPRGSQTAPANYADPVYAYKHGTGDGAASITGGVFYAGGPFPDSYDGRYFFSDYVAGYIKTIDPSNPGGSLQSFGTNFDHPLDLKRAPNGDLWVLNHGDDANAIGSLVRISYIGSGAPFINAQPQSQTVPAGQPATFSVNAGGAAPLSYQWTLDGQNIPGATGSTYTRTASLADNGKSIQVIVSNGIDSIASNIVKLNVVSNQYPTPTINLPATTFKYTAGQSVSFSGSGTDPEDGAIPASRMNWSVVFYHDTHSHPFIDSRPGVSSGSFVIPTVGETASNVWYRVFLTVTDSGGLSRTVSRDVFPVKANVTLSTNVAGAATSGFALTLDGSPIKSNYTFTGVSGIVRQLGAPASQVVNGVTYDFKGWSDGGAASHNISTPSTNKTFIANYAKRTGTSPPPVSGSAVKVNFQPATAPAVSGYLIDAGHTFAARNGRSYGWTVSHTGNVVDRNKNGNQLLDTNVVVNAGARWELALPNGRYNVKVGVGDSAAASTNNVYIEGVWAIPSLKLAANTFSSKTVGVNISDGRLTIGIGGAASGLTRIDYVEVTPAVTSPPSPPPTTTSTTKVNFQPAGAPGVGGYLIDAGNTFGARNGSWYGWTVSHTGNVVDRNKNSNQLLDTNVSVIAGARWELAVASGTYRVTIGVGDSGAATTNNVYVEGVWTLNNLKLAANTFSSKTVTVNVNDGRLTVGIGGAASGLTKFNFIDVTKV